MAPAIASTVVDRPAAQVFAYATDPARFREWQHGVTGGHLDQPGPAQGGAKCLTTRRIGGANRAVTSELTHIDAPRTWGVQGIDGPIRSAGRARRAASTGRTRPGTRCCAEPGGWNGTSGADDVSIRAARYQAGRGVPAPAIIAGCGVPGSAGPLSSRGGPAGQARRAGPGCYLAWVTNPWC